MPILFCLLMATPFEDGSQALLRNDWTGAVVAFTKAIETKPTSRAYVNRGIAYGRLGNDKAAFDDYTTAIKLNPSEPFAYANRGRLYQKANLPDKALQDFNKSLELKPDAKVFDMRGTFHYVEKDYAKARDDFQAALKISPNELNTLNNLAWMEATCPDAEYRDGKAAVERSMKACQLSGWRLKQFASTLAAAYAEAGDFDKAIAIAEKYEDERLEQYRQRKPVRD